MPTDVAAKPFIVIPAEAGIQGNSNKPGFPPSREWRWKRGVGPPLDSRRRRNDEEGAGSHRDRDL